MNNTDVIYSNLMHASWDSVKFGGRPANKVDEEMRNYYVYGHYITSDGFHPEIDGLRIPFYIGMGAGHRIAEIYRRSQAHQRRRLFAHRSGGVFEYGLIKRDLDCHSAKVLESKLIVFWGCVGKSGPVASGLEKCLTNKKYEPYPEYYKVKKTEHTNAK